MKKTITKASNLYHVKNGMRIEGIHSGLRGNVLGLFGDVSELRGDIDDCEISDEKRLEGVDVRDLIK